MFTDPFMDPSIRIKEDTTYNCRKYRAYQRLIATIDSCDRYSQIEVLYSLYNQFKLIFGITPSNQLCIDLCLRIEAKERMLNPEMN